MIMTDTTTSPSVAVLVAGTNEPSNSNVLADAFIEGIERTGTRVEKLRLKDLNIEHFTLENYHSVCHSKDDFCRLQEIVEQSSGILIATPVWNFSVPAHLKNVIDRMGAFALDEATHSKGQMKDKPFYLIFTGGAPVIAWKALMYLTTLHLSEAFKYYGATPVGKHFEARCLPKRGTFGLVVDQRPASLERMRRAGERFGRIVLGYAKDGTLPLRLRLIHAFFTWAYRIGNRIMYPIGGRQ
jgi:multimeric flavodoxin WrbA